MVYALPTTTVLVFSLIFHDMLKGLLGYYFLVEDSYLLSPYYYFILWSLCGTIATLQPFK